MPIATTAGVFRTVRTVPNPERLAGLSLSFVTKVSGMLAEDPDGVCFTCDPPRRSMLDELDDVGRHDDRVDALIYAYGWLRSAPAARCPYCVRWHRAEISCAEAESR